MDLITYENKEYGVVFKYPENWERGESQLGALVVLYPPAKERGFFRENLSFMVYHLDTQEFSLEEYLSQNLKELKESLGVVQKTKQKTTEFGGKEGYQTEYIGGFGDQNLRLRQFCIKVHDKIFILSHTYVASHKSKYHKLIKKIIKSFEFQKKK